MFARRCEPPPQHIHPKDPGQNYLYIRLFLRARCGVAFLGNSPAIAKKCALQQAQRGTLGVDKMFDQGPK